MMKVSRRQPKPCEPKVVEKPAEQPKEQPKAKKVGKK
jgi:hypothetical protein